MQLNNLNIAVLGAGRSGRAAARLAMTHGARVCVFDAVSYTHLTLPTTPYV